MIFCQGSNFTGAGDGALRSCEVRKKLSSTPSAPKTDLGAPTKLRKRRKTRFHLFFFSKNWPFQPFIQYFWQSRSVSFLTSSLFEICIKSKRINFLCTVILKPNFDSATNPIFTLHGPYEHANPKFTLQEQAERDFLLNLSWFPGFIENLRLRGTVQA